MKNYLYILILLFIPYTLFSQKVEKIDCLTNWVQLAAKENKILIIEFWALTCGPLLYQKHTSTLIQDLINKKDQGSCILLCEEAFNKYPYSWEILNK